MCKYTVTKEKGAMNVNTDALALKIGDWMLNFFEPVHKPLLDIFRLEQNMGLSLYFEVTPPEFQNFRLATGCVTWNDFVVLYKKHHKYIFFMENTEIALMGEKYIRAKCDKLKNYVLHRIALGEINVNELSIFNRYPYDVINLLDDKIRISLIRSNQIREYNRFLRHQSQTTMDLGASKAEELKKELKRVCTESGVQVQHIRFSVRSKSDRRSDRICIRLFFKYG